MGARIMIPLILTSQAAYIGLSWAQVCRRLPSSADQICLLAHMAETGLFWENQQSCLLVFFSAYNLWALACSSQDGMGRWGAQIWGRSMLVQVLGWGGLYYARCCTNNAQKGLDSEQRLGQESGAENKVNCPGGAQQNSNGARNKAQIPWFSALHKRGSRLWHRYTAQHFWHSFLFQPWPHTKSSSKPQITAPSPSIIP